ncbi:Nramp family divalent metal transporter [Sporolituus thermophilus]|uniref:NRAMP (Natural resistance-associated macrophage protein) metal ion transporters n=1 Tax=Sporolituus thermophilus DSM 23256 TaxID=1123285 RepID=A0A1G7N0J5_9FIRM|nr:Nramp family divalent metal transporter [Sporolituus thermophilus]SDF66840.1 NRAMP (natural resistance-associated macrophage protein) metal ion transporters [Sporolituus thermophilus DSM 23256]
MLKFGLRWRRRAVLFLSIMGPGIITACADNDAGGIATYAVAGAHYGYSMLPVLLASLINLLVLQEMSARMGAVTGKGLSDLIREQFGVRWAFFATLVLVIANVATTASEFSGIAISLEVFGVSKYLSLPLMAGFIWWLVVRGSYGQVEKIALVLCFTFFSYVISGFIVQPPWREVVAAAITPVFAGDTGYLLMVIGMIGTTITPWGQYYIQASVVDKGITAKDYPLTRLDVVFGTFFTGLVAFFIIIVTATTLHGGPIRIETAQDAALALEPLAGQYAAALFAIGLLGASVLAAFILPLSTAYAVCEAFGFESGISKTTKEAPVFFGLYTLLVCLGAAIALWPGVLLYRIMLLAQVVNGVLLPPVLVFMLLLTNNRRIMGPFTNSPFQNLLAWSLSLFLIFLTLLLIAWALAPDLLAGANF